MKKKWIWIMLILLLSVMGILSGCGKDAPEVQTEAPVAQTEAPTEPAPENELEILTETSDEDTGTETVEFPVGAVGRQQYAQPQISYAGSVNAYNSQTGRYLRSCGKVGDISELSGNEFYSFTMLLSYNGPGVFSWQEACVQVDDCEPWYWSAGQLSSGQSARFYVAKHNMERVNTRGTHTCVWYFDGKPVYSDMFTITKAMDWSSVFEMPTQEQLDAYTNPSARRSPYVNGCFYIPKNTRYTEFAIDFKADYVPNGTYCALGNWNMDDTSLQKQYSEVSHQVQMASYAGFQRLGTGETVAIMSFWDTYCKDAWGNETVIRAERVYPATTNYSEDFSGEGVGAHCLVPYEWEAEHWYRMYLRCVTSSVTGNTVVEQWVCDLETGEYTPLCSYDIGYPDSAFVGSMVVFLENFLTEEAGQVRTLELCNPMYLDEETQTWCRLDEIQINVMDGQHYDGSYRYGVDGNCVWMITSGVGGNWRDNGKGQHLEAFYMD